MAMGVDRAIRIDDARALDPYAVARILRAAVEKEAPQIVLMGKQAVDDDSNQAGQMLAGLLGWPQATFISKIEFLENGARARCTRETDGGLEVIEVDLPAIVTTDLRLNEPRYVSLPGLMKARKKPIEVLTCEQLGVQVEPLTTTFSIARPPKRAAGTRVESVEELVRKLKEEAKVFDDGANSHPGRTRSPRGETAFAPRDHGRARSRRRLRLVPPRAWFRRYGEVR